MKTKGTITYKCGHTKALNLFGNESYCEWKLQQMQDEASEELCPDCKDKQAAEEAKEMGFPELDGSEKQVKWAESIRVELWNDLSSNLKKADELVKKAEASVEARIAEDKSLTDKQISTAKNNISLLKAGYKMLDSFVATIPEIRSSAWFIYHRTDAIFPKWSTLQRILAVLGSEDASNEYKRVVVSTLEEYAPKIEETEESKELKADAEAEATLVPEGKEDADLIEVRTGKDVEIVGDLDYDDYKAVTSPKVGYLYDRENRRIWHPINLMTPSAEDVAAEAICLLLRMGYRVVCYDEKAREMAKSGSYEPEERHWVYRIQYGDGSTKLAIRILDGNDEINAKAIRGARWSHGSVVVPVSSWKEIEDFARIYGYRISAGATEEIEKYKASTTSVTDIKDVVNKDGNDGLAKILESSDDVLADLKDDG